MLYAIRIQGEDGPEWLRNTEYDNYWHDTRGTFFYSQDNAFKTIKDLDADTREGVRGLLTHRGASVVRLFTPEEVEAREKVVFLAGLKEGEADYTACITPDNHWKTYQEEHSER